MKKITNEELGRPTPEEFARMAKMPVVVVLDNVRSLQNVGSFFRTGDAFAVERICLCGITATPPNRDIHKTALGPRRPWRGATTRRPQRASTPCGPKGTGCWPSSRWRGP